MAQPQQPSFFTSTPATGGTGAFGLGAGTNLFGAQQTQQQATPGTTPFPFGTGTAAAPSSGAPGPTIFGTPQQTQPGALGGFNFGGTAAAPAASAAGTSLFGAPQQGQQPAPATPAFTFGTGVGGTAVAAPGAGGGFGTFGQPGTSTTPATSTGTSQPLNFGLGTNTSTGIGATGTTLFGTQQAQQPPTSTTFNFGGGSTAAPAPAAPFGGFGTLGQGTVPGTTSGASTGTTTSGTGTSQPLNFGGLATSGVGATGGAGTSLFGAQQPQPTAPTSFGQPGTTAATSTSGGTTLSAGLGGLAAPSSSSVGASGSSLFGASQTAQTSKELPIPIEITNIIEGLKNHIMEEKVGVGEVARASDRILLKASETIEEVYQQISIVSSILHRHTLGTDSLQQVINEDLKNAEIAQIARDSPGPQINQNITMRYFYMKAKEYHLRMEAFKSELAKAEVALSSLDSLYPMTSRDIYAALTPTKEALIFMAAKVKTLHERVLAEVETHQNLLRFIYGENSRDFIPERSKSGKLMFPGAGRSRFPDGFGAKPDLLFQTKLTDPSKMLNSYISSRSHQGGSAMHSTPVPYQQRLPSYNTASPGFQSFYNMNTSGLHSPLNLTSSGLGSPANQSALGGSALKRSKH